MNRLTVLRHAKSAWPPGVPDHDRPLGPRGRRDAPAAGRLLASGPPIDLVVCSTAARTRQTWDLVAAEFPTPPVVRFEPGVYEASVAELLAVLNSIAADPAGRRHLLLVGHNPGCADTILALADSGAPALRSQVAAKFPTSAVARLRLTEGLEPGSAVLESVDVPRG
jgi:phosphohistidine phosphatase